MEIILAVLADGPESLLHLRLIFQYDIILVQAGCHANLPVVFTYGNALETGSARFSSPGDFFTYVCFVATVIMVSLGMTRSSRVLSNRIVLSLLYFHFSTRRHLPCPRAPRIICPPSLELAEAVPGNEEDRPCIPYSASLTILKGCMRCRYGGKANEIALVIT